MSAVMPKLVKTKLIGNHFFRGEAKADGDIVEMDEATAVSLETMNPPAAERVKEEPVKKAALK